MAGDWRAGDTSAANVVTRNTWPICLNRRSTATTPTAPPESFRDALGIESDDVVNYCFPKIWPIDRELRARIIGESLKTEARYLA